MAWLTTVKHALPTVPCKNLLILGLSQTLWAHVAVENGSMGLKPAALRRDVRICDPLETRPRPTPYVLPCRIWSLWSNHMGVGKIWESQKFETLGTRRPNCVRWHDRPQRDHFSPPDVLFISCRMWTFYEIRRENWGPCIPPFKQGRQRRGGWGGCIPPIILARGIQCLSSPPCCCCRSENASWTIRL